MSEDFASTRPPDDIQFAPTITPAKAVVAVPGDARRGHGERRHNGYRKRVRGRGGGGVST